MTRLQKSVAAKLPEAATLSCRIIQFEKCFVGVGMANGIAKWMLVNTLFSALPSRIVIRAA